MTHLDELRKKIDKVDIKLAKLLAERAEFTRKIGVYKRLKKIPVKSNRREQEVLENVMHAAEEQREYVKEIFKKIMEEGVKLQK